MTVAGRAAAILISGTLYALSGAAMPEPAGAAPVEPATTLAPAGSVSEAVREAQRLLSDLDAWDGPADGMDDAAFRRALSEVQARLGLPATGSLDDATLRRLRTHAEAARTARTLDAARAAETAEARRALAADPELARRLAPRPEDSRAEAGRDLSPCRAAPTPACLLAEARESAKGIVDPELRDWALAEIAAAVASVAGPEAVWPVLRLATDPRIIFTGLRDAAVAQAAAGAVEDAFTTAAALAGLPSEAARAWAAVAQALAHHQPPLTEGARRAEAAALAAVPPEGDAAAVLVMLARTAHALGQQTRAWEHLERAAAMAPASPALLAAWAETGRPERAAADLARLTGEDATPVLVALAAAHARAGEPEAALTAARQVTEPRYRAVALADVGALAKAPGPVQDAESVAEAIELPFAAAYAWARITDAWRDLERPTEALAAAHRIGDDALRAGALLRLAAVLPAAGAEAEEVRAGLTDRVARVRLAAEWAALAPETAETAARTAVDEALAVRNPWNRARALVAAARAVAAVTPVDGGNR